MTLQEFLERLASNPSIIIMYFLCLPIAALLAWFLGRGEAQDSPWKYLYSTVMFLTCIPGIFAITLNVYQFLFERKSIFESDIYTQILPIVSMLITLYFIKKNTNFEDIPGFQKIGGLFLVIGSLLGIMWFLDKTHILVFSYMPFYYVLIIFAVLLAVIRYGSKKVME